MAKKKIPFTPTETLIIGQLISLRSPATAPEVAYALGKKVGVMVRVLKKLEERKFVKMNVRTKTDDTWEFNWVVFTAPARMRKIVRTVHDALGEALDQ